MQMKRSTIREDRGIEVEDGAGSNDNDQSFLRPTIQPKMCKDRNSKEELGPSEMKGYVGVGNCAGRRAR
jgi:hypothetical protein